MRISDGSSDVCSSDLHFLHDLELWQRQRRIANAVGRYLEHVFEECDRPRDRRRDVPRLPAQVLQMRVPRDGHEDVRPHQQACGLFKHREVDWHGGPWKMRIVTVCRRSEEHTSELQSLMRLSYAVFCL